MKKKIIKSIDKDINEEEIKKYVYLDELVDDSNFNRDEDIEFNKNQKKII